VRSLNEGGYMKQDHVWLSCKSVKYGVEVSGLLAIEFEDVDKAREALRRMLRAVAESLEADECGVEKVEK